jgi:DNA invertase Pin-like site-specific DNA recombinase
MTEQPKVGLYARVSTSGKGQNPETQLLELRKYCQDRGWAFTEYVDIGASGKSTNRPALNRLQKDIHYRRINTVAIWKFDRLFRDTREILNLSDDWNRRGVDLISTTENIDTTSPGGRAIFAIMAVIAEFERAVLVERVNAGLRRARAQGKRLGRPKGKVRIPQDIIEGLSQGSLSLYRAAKVTGIPRSTLKRRLAARGFGDNPQRGIVAKDGKIGDKAEAVIVAKCCQKTTVQKGSTANKGRQK